MQRTKPIDGELLKIRDEVLEYALNYGLDFYPVIFEMCDYDTINILASQGGFPARYPHWRFGMDYDQMSKNYRFGMQRIYEMVINTNPVYAYLLNVNKTVDQKTVMAHVYGHADFFKNNAYFAQTDRNMMDVMANHGTKIRRFMDRYGQDKVEEYIDVVLSFENLLDMNQLFRLSPIKEKINITDISDDIEDGASQALKTFMRSKGRKEVEQQSNEEEIKAKLVEDSALPTTDIMKFLAEHAPIEDWQSDVISILREEAYYFLPQRVTKIMNEGWASYWHSTIMTKNALKASEVIDFADHHAGVMAMSRRNINPYKIGIELLRDIEYRWDTGRFGKEYNECDNIVERENWNNETNLGREKIFEVRKTHNDLTFIDSFFTREFCERQQLFTYDYNKSSQRFEISERDFMAIKSKLLNQLTNFGNPVIQAVSANYNNRGEILLEHTHYGVDLDMAKAAEVMANMFKVWKRPINLVTQVEGKDSFYHFDGKELSVKN
jgi:stage V sporulation protein R